MNKLKISTRLSAGFGLLILFSLLMLGSGISWLGTIAGDTREILSVPLRKERLVSDWYGVIELSVQRATAVARSGDDSLTALFAAANAEASKGSNERQAQFVKLISGSEEQALFDALSAHRQAYIKARDGVIALKKEGSVESTGSFFEQQFLPASRNYLASLAALRDFQRSSMDRMGRQIEQDAADGNRFLAMFGLVITAAGVLLAWSITRSILGPLGRAVQVAETVSSGDLTSQITVTSTDEAGQLLKALKTMNENLVSLVGTVRTSSDSIASHAGEIAAGNQDLSQRTEEQASNLEETAASMEELSSTVQANAETTRQATQLASSADTAAVNGGVVVSQVVNTMSEIAASSKKITEIIGTIDDIAFQTNILALNAAIEAARAGEQGRGFAVVASEVRRLAARSASAAQEIKKLIGESVVKIEDGTREVADAGIAMADIVTQVKRVAGLISDISTATNEQAMGISQVSDAVNQLDQVTQQNAALVEQSAAAADSLRNQSARLVDAVSVFRCSNFPAVAHIGASSERTGR